MSQMDTLNDCLRIPFLDIEPQSPTTQLSALDNEVVPRMQSTFLNAIEHFEYFGLGTQALYSVEYLYFITQNFQRAKALKVLSAGRPLLVQFRLLDSIKYAHIFFFLRSRVICPTKECSSTGHPCIRESQSYPDPFNSEYNNRMLHYSPSSTPLPSIAMEGGRHGT